MNTMQFRDYIFPHNPASITVTRGAGAVTLFCPGRGEIVQNLGGGGRTARCEGGFFGESWELASAELESFKRAAEKDGSGTLFLPGHAPFQAYLRELVYEAAGDGRVIPYIMTFVEAEAIT